MGRHNIKYSFFLVLQSAPFNKKIFLPDIVKKFIGFNVGKLHA